MVPGTYWYVTFVAKKQQEQDIQSRLRQLTEETRRTRRELEELIQRSDGERTRALADDHSKFFRRRRHRSEHSK